ncbi:hypothetical protein OAE80_03375, partial [Planctomycetaceae bacterium]|nr:hypothetical protein [Planctomycetaceae bacterium]
AQVRGVPAGLGGGLAGVSGGRYGVHTDRAVATGVSGYSQREHAEGVERDHRASVGIHAQPVA